MDLPWWGLNGRYRLEVNSELGSVYPSLLDYVKDDDGNEIADIILSEQSKVYPEGEIPVFIQGMIPEDFSGENISVNIKLFENNGYEKEKLIEEKDVIIDAVDYSLKNMFYGIQDFNIFRQLEKSGYDGLYYKLMDKLSIKNLLKKENEDIKPDDYPDMKMYRKIRNEFIKSYINSGKEN